MLLLFALHQIHHSILRQPPQWSLLLLNPLPSAPVLLGEFLEVDGFVHLFYSAGPAGDHMFLPIRAAAPLFSIILFLIADFLLLAPTTFAAIRAALIFEVLYLSQYRSPSLIKEVRSRHFLCIYFFKSKANPL